MGHDDNREVMINGGGLLMIRREDGFTGDKEGVWVLIIR
jgi:hypothetical protein